MIVGAGPIGLAAGNLLGMAGIATLLVECNPGLSGSPKAIAIDDEGLRVCQAMGLSTALSNCIVSDISIDCVSEGRLLARVVPRSKRNGYSLISTFYQPEFEAVLLEGLQRFSCVKVRFQHTVEMLEQSADGIVVSVRTPAGALQRIRCAYLLACDGGASSIRQLLNIPLRGKTFAQKWLVIDSISEAGGLDNSELAYSEAGELDSQPAYSETGELDNSQPAYVDAINRVPTVKIYCDSQRPAVSIPAPHNGRRWEFMLLPGETEKEMLEPETISALLRQAGASPHAHIIRQAVYTFHAVQAKTFSRGRVFLLGDAAHMMPPFGGQGLNSGLRDAHNLVWKVAMVLQEQATPQLLATYHEERSGHAARMIAFASFLGAVFMSTARPLANLRNLLIQILYALPIVRAYLMELRMKPQARYKSGFFVFKGQAKRMVGSLLPQPEVMTEEGQRVLLDELSGTGFAVLRRHSNPEEAFAGLKTGFWERLGARFICIQTDDVRRGQGAINRAPTRARDPGEQTLPIVVVRSVDNDFLRMSRDYYVVVRPDRFILGIFKEEDADVFAAAFQRLLHGGQG